MSARSGGYSPALEQTASLGLLHAGRGREPANKSNGRLWQRVLKLAAEKYRGVNDRHLQELLAREHSTHVCRKSLRKHLRAASGMLLQIDASPHDRLEGRGPLLTLVGVIDDATNRCRVRFHEAETTWAYLLLMREVALSQGLPLSLYSDRHDIFHARREPTLAEQLANQRPLTQFGRAVEELGVRFSKAYSPQARGRIERLWGVLQDRLVVELRLAGVATLGGANALLDRYLPGHNRRFSVPPRDQAAVRRKSPDARALDRILCLKEPRVVGRDHVVSFEGLALQVPRSRKFFSLAGRRIDVLQLRDKSIELHHEGEAVARFSHEQVKALAKR